MEGDGRDENVRILTRRQWPRMKQFLPHLAIGSDKCRHHAIGSDECCSPLQEHLWVRHSRNHVQLGLTLLFYRGQDATVHNEELLEINARLYMSYVCPYAQRAWITRNYKGLQEKIKLVPLDMTDKPGWYKEVYPKNQVPSLEHNNNIMGESLDLIKYIDSNFDGPKLVTNDPEKQRFAEELLGYSDAFNRALLDALRSKGPMTAEAGKN
ncbi:unnamed protein product [Miscanthus lutarioriparius]|uniref:GST N-terminal domain-containing protein n=1 Tax=Miscanthus lutarioriparius TaxID=422564 RepID=A0A811M8L3_9POAL|nr:unnamed protein product [Miscanthus lutarioriparius]